jgi:hypothetical protein
MPASETGVIEDEEAVEEHTVESVFEDDHEHEHDED